MAIPSGLGATFGVAQESTVGTPNTTGMRWLWVNKADLQMKKTIKQSEALTGHLYESASRRAFVTRTVDGSITMDLTDRGLGLFFKHALGSNATAVQQGTSPAYLQTHTPGDTLGMSLTIQLGKPDSNGNMNAFTYSGCKITEWQVDAKAGEIGTLEIQVDGWNELTNVAYVAPSYVPSNVLHFAEANLISGGTVTTTGGVATLTGGSPLGRVKSVTIKCSNKLATDRYFIGNNGIKAEQIANGFREITGDIEIEFANLTDVYNLFAVDSSTSLQLTYTGPAIGGGYNSQVIVLLPKVFFDEDSIAVDGPKVLEQKVTFKALDDGTNPPIQVQYQSADTTV